MQRVSVNLLCVFAIIALMAVINAIHAVAQAGINDIAWNMDGSQIAAARDDGSLEIISVDGSLYLLLDISEHRILSVAWSPVDRDILAISTNEGDIQILRVTSDQHIVLLDLPSAQHVVQQVKWSPDGSKLATMGATRGGASSESAVKVWDGETGKLLATYQDGYAFIDIAWHPQKETQLLISGVADHYGAELVLWDVYTQDTVWNVEEPDSIALYLTWDPDGYSFVTSTIDVEADLAILRVHDGATGITIATVPTLQRRVKEMIWNSNSPLAISGLDEIEIWDVSAGYLVDQIQITEFGGDIAWNPDGAKIAYNEWNSKDKVSKVQIVDVPDLGLTPEAAQEAVPTP